MTMAGANGTPTMDFTPNDSYSNDELEPEVPEGHWEASIKCRRNTENKDGRVNPRIIVDFTLKETDSGEECEKYKGSKVSMWLRFPRKGDKYANVAKLEMRRLCEKTNTDLSLIPKGTEESPINGWDDIQPLMDALEENGQAVEIWTKHKVNSETGETRVNVLLRDPAGSSSPSDDEEEEEEKPKAKGKAAPAAKGKAAPAKGKGR